MNTNETVLGTLVQIEDKLYLKRIVDNDTSTFISMEPIRNITFGY